MGKDKRGIERGHCIECECEEYESGAIRCDYCGHTPMSHVPFDPLSKRPKYDEALTSEGSEQANEVFVGEVTDDASAEPQLEGTRHGEELAEQGAGPSNAEPTKEVSVIEVDAGVDVEVVRFQRRIDSITKVGRFVISKDNGKLFAFCNVCNIKMVAGKEHKGQDMFLLNHHVATATHKTIEAICLSRESEIPEAILEIQREVEEKYPRVFAFHKTSILCRSCNLQFSAKHLVVISRSTSIAVATKKKPERQRQYPPRIFHHFHP